jgi:hypothetical protein
LPHISSQSSSSSGWRPSSGESSSSIVLRPGYVNCRTEYGDCYENVSQDTCIVWIGGFVVDFCPSEPEPPPPPSYVNCMIWESCYENITRDYCSQNGGAIVNSCRVAISSSSTIASAPSSSSSEGDSEDCGYWCKWDTGCYKTTPDESASTSCAEAIKNCVSYSFGIYSNPNCTGTSLNSVPLGCCRWRETTNQCWNVYAYQTEDIIDCRDYGWGDWWNGACPNDYGGCPN